MTDLGPIKKHLGAWYEHKKKAGQESFRLSMESYRKDTLKDWREMTSKEPKTGKTPGFPGKSLSKKPGNGVNKESYRKLLRRLMCLTQERMPEALNSI